MMGDDDAQSSRTSGDGVGARVGIVDGSTPTDAEEAAAAAPTRVDWRRPSTRARRRSASVYDTVIGNLMESLFLSSYVGWRRVLIRWVALCVDTFGGAWC